MTVPSFAGSASSTDALAAAADAVADFDFMVATIEQNYAGWETKVAGERRATLADLTARLRAQAVAADAVTLEPILKQWLAFFDDRNLAIGLLAERAEAAPDVAGLDWSAGGVRAYLGARGRRRDPIAGLWRIAGGRSHVAVVRDPGVPGHFLGVAVASAEGSIAPGRIKARFAPLGGGGFAVVYLHGDLMIEHGTAQLVADGAVLAPSNGVNWTREWPTVGEPRTVARRFTSGDLFLNRVDARTLWLRVPDFGEYQRRALVRLLSDNAAMIAATDHLILDLRSNRVGVQDIADQLLPLLCTGPIMTPGTVFRSTALNRSLRQPAAGARDAAITRFPDVRPYPKRVAILIDWAGGVAEQVLLDARQSAKVTLMGMRPTSGALDYFDTVAVRTPSGRYRLRWGTTRSLRLPQNPVDGRGIAPAVTIPASDPDPIAFAARWLACAAGQPM